MKKILVTGSEGYIGQHLVELLISSGHKVFGCDPSWYEEAFVADKVHGYELFKCDFSELSVDDLSGFDAVCHLAAMSMTRWAIFIRMLRFPSISLKLFHLQKDVRVQV